MDKNDIWCVIPVYNNANSIKDIVKSSFNYLRNILVIDDGSTDTDLALLLKDTGAEIIRHDKNRGKGAALLTAINHLKAKHAVSMITIDGDGQHLPEDIPLFINAVNEDHDAIYVGTRNFDNADVPRSSRFGRKFSNMWFKIETGKDCSDTQSGFRAYPVQLISQLNLRGSFYDFEIEVIARAAWAGIPVREISISVVYHPMDIRVSHFHGFKDNLRISLMHTRLIGRCLVPLPHKQLLNKDQNDKWSIILHPVVFFKVLLKESATPMALALSAAVGTVLAVLPLVGLHTIVIIYVTARLHLNKIMALGIQVLYSPPFVPFICIETGHYLRHGSWITQFSLAAFKTHWQNYFYDWISGSLVMAPLYAFIAFAAVYVIATRIQNKL